MADAENGKRTFTHSEVSEKIADGRYVIIFDSKLYDVTSWVPRHPGGELVLRHMIGRDATDQIRVNHSEAVLKKLQPFCLGHVAPHPTINRPLSLEFRKLHAELKKEGYFETDYLFYVVCYARFLSLVLLSIFLTLYWGHTFVGCTLAALSMGAGWQQMAFVGHDTGHNGVTHRRKLDNVVGIFLGNLFGGISMAWWKGSHNVHHLVTNDPEHDPDIQHLPFLAVTERLFTCLYSTFYSRTLYFDKAARVLVSIQHFSYYPLMLLGRFNLYRESFLYLYSHKAFLRWFEIACLLLYWVWFLTLVSQLPSIGFRLYFVLLSHMVTFILHVQITLSHFAMSTEPQAEDEEFIRYQLRTTLDVDCPSWFDFFHGGLQFQLAHHLFPRMPRHNLRRARDRILVFCKEHGLTYHAKTFTAGNLFVLRHLKAIADQVKFYREVASKNAELEIEHQHKSL